MYLRSQTGFTFRTVPMVAAEGKQTYNIDGDMRHFIQHQQITNLFAPGQFLFENQVRKLNFTS